MLTCTQSVYSTCLYIAVHIHCPTLLPKLQTKAATLPFREDSYQSCSPRPFVGTTARQAQQVNQIKHGYVNAVHAQPQGYAGFPYPAIPDYMSAQEDVPVVETTIEALSKHGVCENPVNCDVVARTCRLASP